jgi:hypothetical protein
MTSTLEAIRAVVKRARELAVMSEGWGCTQGIYQDAYSEIATLLDLEEPEKQGTFNSPARLGLVGITARCIPESQRGYWPHRCMFVPEILYDWSNRWNAWVEGGEVGDEP